MRPPLPEVLASAVPFAVPLRVPFRGVGQRAGLLLPGPAGWGEFAPFDDYRPRLAARWLAAALEAAYRGWPAPVRRSVAVNAILPAVIAGQVPGLLAAAGAVGGPPGAPAPTVKVKITGDLAADLARVGAVRDATGPAAAIRLDVNAGWTLQQALSDLPLLETAAGGLDYVEQPLASLAEMARLRRATGVRVAVDESLRQAVDPLDPALLAQVRSSADVAILKVAPLGGVRVVLDIAERLRMPVVVSGAMDTAVGLSAGIAAACALPGEPLPCGLGTGALLAADLFDPPLVPAGGRLALTAPAPDPQALAAAGDRVPPRLAEHLASRLREAWEYL